MPVLPHLRTPMAVNDVGISQSGYIFAVYNASSFHEEWLHLSNSPLLLNDFSQKLVDEDIGTKWNSSFGECCFYFCGQLRGLKKTVFFLMNVLFL